MVNLNRTGSNDDTQSNLIEKQTIDCQLGVVNVNYHRMYGSSILGRFAEGSYVTVYAGSQHKPIDVAIGYDIWMPDQRRFRPVKVYVYTTTPMADVVDKFLTRDTISQKRKIRIRPEGMDWIDDVEVPAGHSIMEVANFLLTPEGEEVPSVPKLTEPGRRVERIPQLSPNSPVSIQEATRQVLARLSPELVGSK